MPRHGDELENDPIDLSDMPESMVLQELDASLSMEDARGEGGEGGEKAVSEEENQSEVNRSVDLITRGSPTMDGTVGRQSFAVTNPQVKEKQSIELGDMFICSHQGRMQYLMGRELVNENNELIIFSDLKINLGQLESYRLYEGERVGKKLPSDDTIQLLFNTLPDEIKRPAEKVSNKSLYDYFMCSSYIKFKNCAILRLKFDSTADNTGTRLIIELIHEGSLEKDEEIVTNTKGEEIYWVKGAASQENDGLNANQRCEFPTIELTLGKSATFNIQGDIFVMRHGYSEHNRAKMDDSKKFYSDLTDAALTPAGVKQCVEAAEAFESEKQRRERNQLQPLIPSDFKYCCSDLRRTWQSLSAFNLKREVYEDITMLPYMHEFEYKSIIPYAADDAFLTKGYLAAGGKFLGRLATATEVGSLAVAGTAAAAAGLGFAAAAPMVAPALMLAGAAAFPAMADQYGTRADDKSEKGFRGFFKKPSTFKNKTKVRRRRFHPLRWQDKKKNQGGGMKWSAHRAMGRPGGDQFIRMLATENRSKFRDQGVFVGTEFTAEIPRLDTVTINTDFYRTIKSDDPVLQEYRYTFFGILIECNNHIPIHNQDLRTEDLIPEDKGPFASFKRSLESKGSGQEKVKVKGILNNWRSGNCRIQLMQGDITGFGPGVISGTEDEPTSKFAIVNAASVRVVGNGALGVDKSIFEKAGGLNSELEKQRQNRVKTGATLLVPGRVFSTESTTGNYGDIRVKHIIHAIPPDFGCITNPDQGNKCHGSTSKEDCIRLLQRAYQYSIAEAVQLRVEYLAFPILSGNIFKGRMELDEIVKIGIQAIDGAEKGEIKVIFIYGFNSKDYRTLKEVSTEIIVKERGQGGGYRKTHRKKTRKRKKKTSKKTRKKTRKKTKGTKMRKKKTHKRTKKNKKNKRNP